MITKTTFNKDGVDIAIGLADIGREVERMVTETKIEQARHEGRKEAWDLFRRIALNPADRDDAYTLKDLDEAFGTLWYSKIAKLPVEAALDKDRRYQEKLSEKKKLHVGDEVILYNRSNIKGYVVDIDANRVRVLTKEIGTTRVDRAECHKTGKHNPDIVKVMESFDD